MALTEFNPCLCVATDSARDLHAISFRAADPRGFARCFADVGLAIEPDLPGTTIEPACLLGRSA